MRASARAEDARVSTTDAQVRKLMDEMTKHGRAGIAAMRAGMDRKTARKYLQGGKLPSELVEPRDWRTHEDPFATALVDGAGLADGLHVRLAGLWSNRRAIDVAAPRNLRIARSAQSVLCAHGVAGTQAKIGSHG